MFISVYYWQHLNTTQVLERQREREIFLSNIGPLTVQISLPNLVVCTRISQPCISVCHIEMKMVKVVVCIQCKREGRNQHHSLQKIMEDFNAKIKKIKPQMISKSDIPNNDSIHYASRKINTRIDLDPINFTSCIYKFIILLQNLVDRYSLHPRIRLCMPVHLSI